MKSIIVKNVRNSLGLSTIEVLIVMAIALPMIMAFMGAFNSFTSSHSQSLETEMLQSTMTRIIHDITQEIHAADDVEIVPGVQNDRVVVSFVGGQNQQNEDQVEYKVVDGALYKNSVRLNDERLNIQLFKSKNIAKSGGVPLFYWTISIESKRTPQAKISQQFALSLRQNSIGGDGSSTTDKLSF